MIIKSMSRKHPTFAQLIDYIEGESKLQSREYSIYHNTYTRKTDQLTSEFEENARHLKQRKNGVYLYHEVVSITRTQHIAENEQKSILKCIVESYIQARGKNNLAYAVLHEDTDNLHFHIVMSSNEAGNHHRKRLSKEQFSDIQNRLEAWVLKEYPNLEQKAVFHKNQTREERAEREAKRDQKAQLSNKGEELKRRGGKTSIRDEVQECLTDIFQTVTNPREFTDRMEQAGFTLYTRGQTHGVTDRDGNKYRLARLGLAEAWESLNKRMMEALEEERKATMRHTKTEPANARHQEAKTAPSQEPPEPAQKEAKQEHEPRPHAEQDPITTEAEKRLVEMRAYRSKQATKTQSVAEHHSKNQGS